MRILMAILAVLLTGLTACGGTAAGTGPQAATITVNETVVVACKRGQTDIGSRIVRIAHTRELSPLVVEPGACPVTATGGDLAAALAAGKNHKGVYCARMNHRHSGTIVVPGVELTDGSVSFDPWAKDAHWCR